MTHRSSAVLVAVLVALALAGCTDASPGTASAGEPTVASEPSAAAEPSSEAPEPSDEPAAAEERVRIDGSAYDPEELTIAVGTEVTWVNADNFEHTVTEGTDGVAVEDPIVDEEVAQNGTVSVTFDEPGTYQFTCRIHPSMQMTIVVEG